MKKILVITWGILLLNACEKEDAESRLTVNVDVSTIVKGMKDGNNEDYYTSSDTRPVMLTCLIYDAQDALVYKTTEKLANFFRKSSFATSLKEGDYTIVAWACIADENMLPDWEAENEESLDALQLNANYYPNAEPVLGVSKTSLSLRSHFFKNETVTDISVETVGALYAFVFNYARTTNAANLVYLGHSDNTSYRVQTAGSDIQTDMEGYIWDDIIQINTTYTGTSKCLFFLPMQQKIDWGTADAYNNLIRTNTFSFQVEAGKHTIVNTNTDTGVTTFTSATKSADSPSSPAYGQSFDVGRMEAKPAGMATKRNFLKTKNQMQ
jgi:hypothetical protein